MNALFLLLLPFAPLAAEASSDALRWDFDHPRDVIASVNLDQAAFLAGRYSGQTAWDPHFGLRLPKGGIDARKFSWLSVRLYSSAPADLLDVYYESPEKRWCLGGKFRIVAGWATYRMDLNRNHWRETATGDVSRQWGGPSKRVASLRLDPGNQAERFVMVDWVTLEPARPGLVEGVVAEPRGKATIHALEMPSTVEAGRTLHVTADLTLDPPPGLKKASVALRVVRGKTLLRRMEKTVEIQPGRCRLEFESPLSAYWHPGAAEVSLELAEFNLEKEMSAATLAIVNPRVGKVSPPRVELRRLGGDAGLFVNGRPFPAAAFLVHGGIHREYHREAAAAGVNLYCDWFGTSTYGDLGHVAPDRYDYAEFDRYFGVILDDNPNAWFLPHIGVTGPRWWQQAHPEELCQFEDGKRGPPSFASKRWQREMGEDLRRLLAYLRQAPYADRIIGYAFYNGYTAEWQMWGTWKPSPDDYSEPARGAFREFLAQQYASDAALEAAWGDPQVRRATAELPNGKQRNPGGLEVFRDPRREQMAIDFYRFASQMDADALLHFARIVRQATPGTALVGTYYAYLTAHGQRQQDSGHLAARRVFDSPDIDFLMSPPNYWYRKPGEAATFMSATDSFRFRGKLWWDESDHRTHLSDPAAGYGRASNLAESLGVFWREFGEVLTKRAAVSWFDMQGGWFSDPAILGAIGRSQQIAAKGLASRRPFQPEICVLVDPESFYWMRPTQANAALVLRQVTTMPQSGAPWDFCLLDDLSAAWMPDYKLYVFLNAFRITPERRAMIHAKLRRNRATALWAYAPGWIGAEGRSLAGIEALCGIRVAVEDRIATPQLVLEAGDPLAKGLEKGAKLGAGWLKISPQFYANDPAARVAGRLADGGRAGLVIKPQEGWTSIYSAAMQLPPALMRNIAREAGVHIWLDSEDALYADGDFVTVHASQPGEKTLHLPVAGKPREVISGRPLQIDGQKVRFQLDFAETALIQL